MWWENAVIYQIYPRSFQDSDGDGVGDLTGILARLDHVASLGADAIWLSPFYPSPNADFGYDVRDFTDVDPAYGTLGDFDRLIAGARERGLMVLVDFVPCHTSTQHPWFREHPDFYFWADQPPNNWQATFGGGSAWARDPQSGRFYLHSFFPEQADLNWRNPEVRDEMTRAIRFWLERGVDGFRLDALDRLFKDPALRDDPPAEQPFPLPLDEQYGTLNHIHSANAPDIGVALDTIRRAVGGAYLVGEVYLPTEQLAPYLRTLDTVFAFEAMNAGPDAGRLISAIEAAVSSGKLGWVLSNHDFERFATRFGSMARAAAVLFLALPGPVFLFQGDEIAQPDGPGVEPALDRAGRDPFRHPMPWDNSRHGGFTTGEPWLPVLDTAEGNVAVQEHAADSMLQLFRALIGLRRELSGQPVFREAPDSVVLLERGRHMVAANFGAAPAVVDLEGEILLSAPGDEGDTRALPPGGAWITRR